MVAPDDSNTKLSLKYCALSPLPGHACPTASGQPGPGLVLSVAKRSFIFGGICFVLFLSLDSSVLVLHGLSDELVQSTVNVL